MRGLTPYFAAFESSIRRSAEHPHLQAALKEIDALREHHKKELETIVNADDPAAMAQYKLSNL